MCQYADLHEFSVHPRSDFIEFADNSMLGYINGHFCCKDLATLPQQVLIGQPTPTVVHLLYLVSSPVTVIQQ